MSFVAGWNMPGCLPEVAPAIFDERDDAIAYLVDVVSRWWDEDYQSMSGEEADDIWLELHTDLHMGFLRNLEYSGDFKYAFWIEEN